MPSLEQCTRRCLTLFTENYGGRRRLNCLACVAAESRAKRRRAAKPGAGRRCQDERPAEVSRKPRAA
jgi:hypothetical protein